MEEVGALRRGKWGREARRRAGGVANDAKLTKRREKKFEWEKHAGLKWQT